ncbi:MAG TPA: PKD domain-containing protein, partial [Firmicutes bacterium]|nr:PKD domain-containing protein [Bacillota bacterium]
EGQAISWSKYSGSLPPGLSLSSGGTISGTIGQLLGTTTYSFRVKLTDGTNNTYKDLSIKVVADNDSPVIDSYSPSSSSLTMDEGDSQDFSVSAHDPEGQSLSYTWTKDGASVGSGNSFTYHPGYDEAGSHTIGVTVSDGSNNVSRSWSVTVNDVDNVPPEVSIYWPPSNNGSSSVTFQWYGSDDKTPSSQLEYRYKLDNGNWSGWSSDKSRSYSGLSLHWHTFKVEVRDNAGNTGSDSKPYHVMIPAPGNLHVSMGYGDYYCYLYWSAPTDAEWYEVKWWRQNPYESWTKTTSSSPCYIDNLIPGVTYYFRVRGYCSHDKPGEWSDVVTSQ